MFVDSSHQNPFKSPLLLFGYNDLLLAIILVCKLYEFHRTMINMEVVEYIEINKQITLNSFGKYATSYLRYYRYV